MRIISFTRDGKRPKGAAAISPGQVIKDGLKGQKQSAQGIALGIQQA